MSTEVRRASLITLGPQKTEEKAIKKGRKTLRIALNLPESTEDNCPEFNYKDELVNAKRRMLEKPQVKETNGGLDPFNDNDDDVKRIAAEMEAKYGLGVTKKRKFRKDDYADIGMGYDESDSFIDNTDGYDEIIPKNVTTLHGGFYINCGALEFKTDDEATSDGGSEDETPSEKVTSRKRILESSTESEGDEETDKSNKVENSEKKPKLLPNRNSMQRALKKRLFSHDKIKQMRKKRQQDSKAVRDSLKERRSELCGIPHVNNEMKNGENVPKEIKKPVEIIPIKENSKKPETCEDSSSRESTSEKQNENSSDSNDMKNKLVDVVITKLPENLAVDIVELVESIKKAAACSTEGKVKFFSGHVNTMLLELERKCRCLGKQSRFKVYEHLAPFVKCRKETLVKRAKNLILGDDLNKVKGLIEKLKTKVDRTMPNLLEAYESESQKILHKKFSKEAFCNDDNKFLRLPKRRYLWDDETKKTLRDLISLRKKCYVLEGKRKESCDDLLTVFLKTEVQILWPDGWMSMSVLLRLCGIAKKPPEKVVINSKDLTITPSTVFPNHTTPVLQPNTLTITPIPTDNELKSDIDVKEEELQPVIPKEEITQLYQNDVKEESKEISTIVIDECPVKTEFPNPPPLIHQSVIKHEPPNKPIENNEKSNHCEIVDLTEQSYVKKKPGPKSKTKYYYEYPEKSKYKDYPQMSLGDKIPQNITPTPLPEVVRFAQNTPVNCDLLKESEKPKYKSTEGDDIQTVMESLRVLQKMSSPGKPNEEHKTSSPVSVIAFNKTQSLDSNTAQSAAAAAAAAAANRNSSFQDAFQKRFIQDFNLMKACHSGSSSKNNYTSIPKLNHAGGSSMLHQTPNDYAQHGIPKVKTSSSQQPGSYNIMDDMFTLLLNQYECSKAANPKPS